MDGNQVRVGVSLIVILHLWLVVKYLTIVQVGHLVLDVLAPYLNFLEMLFS